MKLIRDIILLCSFAPALASANPWAEVITPTAGPARIYGTYGAGCIAGAVPLPMDGRGYQVIRPSRNKFWGHPDLVAMAQSVTSELANHGIVMLAADLAQPRGGPIPSDHASHNIGLDMDFWFRQDERALQRPLTPEERESITKVELADLERNELNENLWDGRYELMLKTVASHPAVERMFVHPTIKRKLCANPANHEDWLRKIRPWWGHNGHFHVRIACPASSPECVPQAPQTSIACDETLDWWFSDEWREEWERRQQGVTDSTPQPAQTLPRACQSVLSWVPPVL